MFANGVTAHSHLQVVMCELGASDSFRVTPAEDGTE
jgi:hypothetical protein